MIYGLKFTTVVNKHNIVHLININYRHNDSDFNKGVAGVRSKVNHWLSLVRMAVLISQRDHVCCVVCAEVDGQLEHLHQPIQSINQIKRDPGQND